MTMPSTSKPATASPISRVPYDILLEIFTDCLPQYPLLYQQPNTTIAPLLLCHICISWRTAALASPTLWTHLCFCLTIVEDYSADPNLETMRVKFVEREIKFIRWWRMNQGDVAPLLEFRVDECSPDEIKQRLTGDGIDSLVEYATSAQYLVLAAFFWGKIEKKIVAGHQVIFPNLHTLLAEYSWLPSPPFYRVQLLLPNHAFSRLRNLSVIAEQPPYQFAALNRWSTLTHVSLRLVIPLHFWFSFTRAVPNLQWGHFNVTLLKFKGTTPPRCTLRQLTTLFVCVSGRFETSLEFPLRLLFTDLHLPVLRTLSLSSPSAQSWTNHRAITELYGVLQSAPAITKLSLHDNFLLLHTHKSAHKLIHADTGLDPCDSAGTFTTSVAH